MQHITVKILDLNKKVHLFSTFKGLLSVQWPIIAIGNFVK